MTKLVCCRVFNKALSCDNRELSEIMHVSMVTSIGVEAATF